MKTQAKKTHDFKPQPLKGIYDSSEELGRDMSRFLLESLLGSVYNQSRNKQVQ